LKKKKAIMLLVLGVVLLAISSVFAYATYEQITEPTEPPCGEKDGFFWDNFDIPPSTSIGPAILSGAF